MSNHSPLLEIDHLSIQFGQIQAVLDFSTILRRGEILGLVGESGSGKTLSMMAVMGLLTSPEFVTAKRFQVLGQDWLALTEAERRHFMGKQIAMIFQDPQSSLNPKKTVRQQLKEVLSKRAGLKGRALNERILQLLHQVGIPDPAKRMGAFPHQLSGGLNQRVMIAIALACTPQIELFIADEPTTALDVTVQAQIISLLLQLQAQHQMAMVLISHDLLVVSQVAHRVAVMYAGEIVEVGETEELFDAPRHPYTAALLEALPEKHLDSSNTRLSSIPGGLPDPTQPMVGCRFAPRCSRKIERCTQQHPELEGGTRLFRCFNPVPHPNEDLP